MRTWPLGPLQLDFADQLKRGAGDFASQLSKGAGDHAEKLSKGVSKLKEAREVVADQVSDDDAEDRATLFDIRKL